MNRSEPKTHHLTSKNYLSSFLAKNQSKLFRYDKQQKEIKELPLSSIGGENDYYSMYFRGEKSTWVENPFLSQIDGDYTLLRQKFENYQPVRSFYNEIVLFVSLQYARVRPQRDRVQTMFEGLNSQRALLGVEEKDLATIDNNLLNRTMFIEAEIYSRVLINTTKFRVLLSENRGFVTCDNPADKSMIPLADNMCLMLTLEEVDEEYVLVSTEFVSEINKLTFKKAHRWVYASSKDLLDALLKSMDGSGAGCDLGQEEP